MFQRHFLVFALIVAVVGVPAFLSESGIVSHSETDQVEKPANSPQQGRKISLSPAEFDTRNPSLGGQNLNNSGYTPGSTPVQLPRSLGNANASPAAAPIRGLPFSTETAPNREESVPGNMISQGYRGPSQPTPGMSEIFRFDLTPQVVKSRWTRVSVTPTDYGLKAMRVALVTGTTPKDVHGALTYYFDQHQRLQRITLRGWSGDASRLVKLVTSEYGFKAQNTHMSGLYLAKTFLHTKGALLMQDADVIDSKNPTQQVAISMEINNPDGSYILSPEFSNMLPR